TPPGRRASKAWWPSGSTPSTSRACAPGSGSRSRTTCPRTSWSAGGSPARGPGAGWGRCSSASTNRTGSCVSPAGSAPASPSGRAWGSSATRPTRASGTRRTRGTSRERWEARPMPRAIWSGAISFGLVNVPVKLFSAVSPKDVRFNQLEEGTGARIRQKRVSAETGEEVPYEKIVKGYEVSPDRYVIISPEELEALDPKATRAIDIEDFVDLDQIDPVHYERPYYLVPEKGAAKAYKLLLDAMKESNKVAIA